MAESRFHRFGWQYCWLCGRPATDVHHIFYGAGLRRASEFYGMTAHLCRECHTDGPESVHKNHEVDHELKKEAERFLLQDGWTLEQFRSVFRKNYLDEDELPAEEEEIRDPYVPDHLKRFI